MVIVASGMTIDMMATAADSAQAVAAVYTMSLLATVPVLLALAAAVLLRRAHAEARTLVWRSAAVALLAVFVGRPLPLHWMAWVMPSTLAAPLVALGRIQVLTPAHGAASGAAFNFSIVQLLLSCYLAGVVLVLLPTATASFAARRMLRRARRLDDGDAGWRELIADVAASLGVRTLVRVYASHEVVTPMTWGVIHPVVVLPADAGEWNMQRRRMTLLHELAHIRAVDWAFNLAARVACALYWFHPGAWWVARGLHADCELACDDRVLAAGVLRSDYAELLLSATHVSSGDGMRRRAALAFSDGGVRSRLAAILDVRHDVRPVARGWTVAAALATAILVGPLSAVQLAPTHDVLTALMRDTRWESRAYAVLGLAQRVDSVAMARAAAEADPSPRVRAWARYALALH